MSESSNNKDKLLWSYSEKWGFTILGVGVLLLFGLIGYWIWGVKPIPESHHIQVFVTADTINSNVKDLYTRAEVDTLIDCIKNHEALLDKKYQYILDQKEEEDRLKTYLVIIVSIILSIAAFFGFKTISDLKKQCREESEALSSTIAEKKAIEVAEKKAEQKAEAVAAEKAKTIAEGKAKTVAEEKAKTIAEEKAKSIAEDTAKSTAQEKAKTVAEDIARKVAEEKAKIVAEETAKAIAEQEAKSIAEGTAKSISEAITKTECKRLVKDLSEPIARQVAQETANSRASEYLNEYLKREVEAQIAEIQQTEVFQTLRRENEELIRGELRRIRLEMVEVITPSSSQAEDSATENSAIEDDVDPLSPEDLDFSLGNEN